jgi:ferric-dicitrate binding protein FerR (iron transport regulator)
MTDGQKTPDNGDRLARRIRALPDVDASAAFRERLRAEFVSGDIEARASEGASDSGAASGASRPARRWRWWAIPPAVAAGLVILFVWLNRAPSLEVLAVSGRGEIRIGDRSFSVSDRRGLEAAVRPGVEVAVPPGVGLDLRVAGIALYEIAGGTRLTLPDTPGRWIGRGLSARIHAGELRLKTGPGFAGCRLRVVTPEGLVEITGTLLSVQCDAGGTCVCVLSGTARVGVDESDLEPVKPGFRKIMLRDGTRKIIPVKPMHRDGVLDFDRRVGGLMNRGPADPSER